MAEETTITTTTAPTENPVTTTTAAPATETNPFDFSREAPDPNAAPPPEVDAPNDAPYVLDMGSDYDGTPEITAMITAAAQDCGLEAGAAGRFVAQVCAGLVADQQASDIAGTQALMKEWGTAYDANMKGAGQFLAAMARRLGIANTQAFMNPEVFRLAHAVRMMGGERAAAGTTGTTTRTNQQKFDAMMNDPNTQAILMNPLHKDYRKVAAEANSCLPSPLF